MSPFHTATFILTLVIALSWLAKHHWILDIFRHFKFQYIIALTFLSIAFLIMGDVLLASINLSFLGLCLIELKLIPHQTIHKNTKNAPTFKLVQYNKYYKNNNLDEIEKWIIQSNADVIVIQEAASDISEWAGNFVKTYPHKIHDPKENNPYGIMILSKTAFSKHRKFHVPDTHKRSEGYSFTTQPKGCKKPISFFTFHAPNAMPNHEWQWRNNALEFIGDVIAEQNSDHQIFLGDWNTTPYSPFFKRMLKKTKLNLAYNIIPFPTWPSVTPLPYNGITQIPIDHILFGNAYKAVYRKIGHAMGSDHYPIEMDFVEK